MKKLSRVASIESETASTIVYSDNDSITCDDEDRCKQDNADSNKGTEIVDFMKKIEFMKRERSALWLEEFQKWMTHVSDDHVKNDIQNGPTFIPNKEKDPRKKRRLKHFGKKSRYISGSAEVFEDDRRMELQESYYPNDDLSINTVSHETQDMILKSYYDKRINPTTNIQPPEDEATCSNNGIKVEGLEMKVLDTVDDIIEARSSSVYAGSPPHYQEDILHRRHNLEEEFLQLSAESYSVASSDSYTSDSVDDYGEIGSVIRNESTTDDHSRSMDSISFVPSEDLYYDKRRDASQFTENGSCSLSSEQLGNSFDGSLHDGEIVGLVKQEANWLEKKLWKRKPKPRVISLTEKTTQTDDANDSQNLNYSAHDVQEAYRRESGMSDYQMLVEGGEILSEKNLSGLGTEEFISKIFKVDLADFGVQETCRQYVCCNCLLEDPSGCSKSGMALLLSGEQKLHVVLLNGRHDGSGSSPSLVGYLGTGDVKEVLVGLGLQAVRVYAKRGARYMFITRSIEKSRLLISVLEFFHSNAKKKGFPLISLDKIQVALFERDVCGGCKTNILQYSMVLFWNNSLEDNQWFSRSLFVLGGYMLVCIEDISQFGFDSQDTFTPYFSLDTCCSVVNALEMVIDTKESCCVTLSLNSVTSEFSPWDIPTKSETGPVNTRGAASVPVTWKLRWFSEDSLFKFVALVKALHAGAGPTSPLNIRYAS